MELRHLRYFRAVAEEGHITRAAERLHIAQPALTQQIKALETELGVTLLRRVGRGVVLTEAGAAFAGEAAAILDRARVAVLSAQEIHRGHAGRVAIGLAETASFAAPVTELLKAARERWPGVEFALSQARTLDLLAGVVDHRLDLAFVRSPVPADTPLASFAFLTEGFVVAMPVDHPLSAGTEVELTDLGCVPLIITSGRPYDTQLREGVIGLMTDQGLTPDVVQRVPEYATAINLVAAGFGLTVVPAVLRGLRHESVAYRPLNTIPQLRTHIVVVHRRGEPSRVALNLLSLAAELASG